MSLDTKVVEMQLDNSDFQDKARQTLNTANQLEQGLQFKDASAGMAELSAAAGRVDLSPIGAMADTVSSQFSAMEVVAFTVVQRITNSVLNMATNIVSSFTNSFRSGYAEYNNKLQAAKTITSATNMTLEEVNGNLQELANYSNKTIYSFDDMTNSVTKFVNAGIDMKKADQMIMGIGNAAAMAGANTQQASSAMDAFTKAIGNGKMQTRQWYQISLTAHMDTVQFKNAMIEAAEAAGTLKKGVDGVYRTMKGTEVNASNFQSTLEEGWLNAEAMTNALLHYSDTSTELGKKAMEAAAQVQTFSGMMNVLTMTFQNGWDHTFEYIFGDLEEAKQFWTDVMNTVGGALDKITAFRNGIAKSWHDRGGRDAAVKSLKTILDVVNQLMGVVSKAFRNVTEPLMGMEVIVDDIGHKMADRSKAISEFLEKIKPTEDQLNKLTRALTGVFSVFDIIGRTIGAVVKGLAPLGAAIGKIFNTVLGVNADLGDAITNFDWFLRKQGVFEKITEVVSNVCTTIASGIDAVLEKGKEIYHFFKDNFGTAFEKIGEGIKIVIDAIKFLFASPEADKAADAADKTVETMDKVATKTKSISDVLGSVVKPIIEVLKKFIEVAAEFAKRVGSALVKSFHAGDFKKILDIFNAIKAGGVLSAMTKFFKLGGSMFSNLGGTLKDASGISKILSQLGDTFKTWQEQLKSKTLITIAKAVALVAASLFVLSLIDADKLVSSVIALSVVFTELMAAMAIYSKIVSKGKLGSMADAIVLVGMATAVLILSAAFKSLADLDMKQIVHGMVGLAACVAAVVIAAKVLSSENKTKMIASGLWMKGFAKAVKIMAEALMMMSGMSWLELAKGATGLGVCAGIMVASAKILSAGDSNSVIKGAMNMLVFAIAMNVMAGVMKSFSGMSWEQIGKGAVGLGVCAGEIVVAAVILSYGDSNSVIKGALNMVIFASAMAIMAAVMRTFTGMNWEQIGKGAVGLGACAGIMVASAVILSHGDTKSVIKGALNMVIFAAALKIVAGIVKDLGRQDQDTLAKGLTALGIGIAEVATGLHFMKGTLGASAALLVASNALIVLGVALKLLATMSWGDIIRSLAALAGAFIVLGVGASALSLLIPEILALAGAMVAMALACTLAGVGMLAFGIGLQALAVGLGIIISIIGEVVNALSIENIVAKLNAAISAFLDMLITNVPKVVEVVKVTIVSLLDMLITLIPKVAHTIYEFIGNLLDLVIALAPKIGTTVTTLLNTLLQTVIDVAPKIGETILTLLDTVLTVIQEAVPEICETVVTVVEALLDTLVELTPEVVLVGMRMLIAFLQGIADNIEQVVDAGANIIVNFLNGLSEKLPEVVDAAFNLIITFINSLADAISGNTEPLLEAVRNLFSAVLEAGLQVLTDGVGSFQEVGGLLMQNGFIAGIVEKISNLVVSVKLLISTGLIAAKSKFTEWVNVGKQIINGLVQGIKSFGHKLVEGIKGVVGDAIQGAKNLLGIKSPSRVFAEIGKYVDLGFVKGINKYADSVSGSAEGMAQNAVDAVSGVISRIGDSINDNMDIDPTITPVLDLSNIERGGARIKSLLNSNQAIAIGQSVSDAADLQFRQNDGSGSNSTVNFTQNNYSPKALSRYDIYRQTRNQLSMMKGLVNS